MSGVEVATKISELVATNPPGSDPKSEGDNHLRLIKAVLQDVFDDSGATIKTTLPIESPAGAKFVDFSTTGNVTIGGALGVTDDLTVGDAATIGGLLTANAKAKIVGVTSIGMNAPATGIDSLYTAGRISLTTGLLANGYTVDGANIKAIAAGYVFSEVFNPANGAAQLLRSSANVAANAVAAFDAIWTVNADKTVQFANEVKAPSISLSGQAIATQGFFLNSGGYPLGMYPASGGLAIAYTPNYYLLWDTAANLSVFSAGLQRVIFRASDAAFIMTAGQAYKPGGGPFADSSDARIKSVQGDYSPGLDEVIQLRPVVYQFLGNDTPDPPENFDLPLPDGVEEAEPKRQARAVAVPYENSPHYQAAIDGQQFVGLIAQEVEAVFPGMVNQRAGYIDGEAVEDLRDLDTTNLIFALVNAVKTLNARLEALESV